LASVGVIGVAVAVGVIGAAVAVGIANTDPTFPRPVSEDARRWSHAEIEAWGDTHCWDTTPWRQPPTEAQRLLGLAPHAIAVTIEVMGIGTLKLREEPSDLRLWTQGDSNP